MAIHFVTRKGTTGTGAVSTSAEYDAVFVGTFQGTNPVTVQHIEGDEIPVCNPGDTLIIEGGGWFEPRSIQRLIEHKRRVIVRIHAAAAFLYFEHPGACMTEYIERAQAVGAETVFVSRELAAFFKCRAVGICYPIGRYEPLDPKRFGVLRIGAFGALRPLKNHMAQLLAAADLKKAQCLDVELHINAMQQETTAILPDLRRIAQWGGVKLVERSWRTPQEFREHVIPSMSIGACMSFAESFCITAADFVNAGIPIIARHIPWWRTHTGPSVFEMSDALRRGPLESEEWNELYQYTRQAKFQWRGLLECTSK